jgi:hypothetical protein
MKKTALTMFLLMGLAITCVAGVIKLDMAPQGTSYSITNGAGSVEYKTVLIKYDGASTNTVTFSKTDANGTFLIGSTSATNAAAATDVWENSYTIPFELNDVFVIGTTDTNLVLEIITE